MHQVYTFLPSNEAYTKRKALKKYYTLQLTCIVIAFIVFIIEMIKTNWEINHKSISLIGLFMIIVLLSPIINLLFSRFPIKIEISELSKSVRATYLNGLGNQKEDIIGIENALIRYTVTSAKNPKSGMQCRIVQNLFNNWIHISLQHGFTQLQILDIYEKAKSFQSNNL